MRTNSKAPFLWIQNVTKYQQQQKKIQGSECPYTTPYSVRNKCITCPQGNIFNTSSLLCTTCSAGFQYDEKKYQCVKTQTPLVKYKNNANASRLWIKNLTQYNKTYQASKGKECPINTPYSLTDKCIACQND